MLLKQSAKKRKNEAGSIMTEVLVVAALIGALVPLVYRQVADRVEETRNVTLAGELRAVREGFESYLAANYHTFPKEEAAANAFIADFNKGSTVADDVCPYMHAYCSEETPDDGTDNFILKLLPYTGMVQTAGENPIPSYRGIVIPRAEALPDLNTKRAARIATLAGAEAGIYTDLTGYNSIDGVSGIWSMSDTAVLNLVSGALGGRLTAYVAVTSPDLAPILQAEPQKFYTETKTGIAPQDMAFGRLHAWQHFSAGGNGISCLTNVFGSARGDDNRLIREAPVAVPGEGSCDPLFWVGSIGHKDASGNIVDESAGHAYVRDNMLIGHVAGASQAAIELTDNAGNGSVVVRGTHATGQAADLTIADGQIKSAHKAVDKTGAETDKDAYFDPAFTSQVGDIQLTARGNAALSDILPNYILKAVYPISCTGDETDNSCVAAMKKASGTTMVIPKPDCEPGYAPALIVTPTKWDAVTKTTTDASGVTTVQKFNFAVEVGNSDSNAEPSRFYAFDFGGKDAPRSEKEAEGETQGGTWRVKFGYKNATDDTGAWTATTPFDDDWSAYALAQTYCVYDPKDSPCPPAGEPLKIVWNSALNACVECLVSSDCQTRTDGKTVCDTASNMCVECMSNADCGSDEACESSACVTKCFGGVMYWNGTECTYCTCGSVWNNETRTCDLTSGCNGTLELNFFNALCIEGTWDESQYSATYDCFWTESADKNSRKYLDVDTAMANVNNRATDGYEYYAGDFVSSSEETSEGHNGDTCVNEKYIYKLCRRPK